MSSNPPTWLISPPFQTSILHTHFIVSHMVVLHILDSSLVFAMIIVSFKLMFYLLKYRNLVKPCVVKLYCSFWIHLLMLCLVDIFSVFFKKMMYAIMLFANNNDFNCLYFQHLQPLLIFFFIFTTAYAIMLNSTRVFEHCWLMISRKNFQYFTNYPERFP